MSRREDIDNAIWSDPEFHGLSPAAKLLYVWSFTNPRCGMAGIYKVVLDAVALETGLSGSDVHAAFEELRQGEFVFYDGGVLWVRTRVKHLRTKTLQIAKSIGRDLEQVGGGPLTEAFIGEYKGTAWAFLREVLLNLNRGSGEVRENSGSSAENDEPHSTLDRTSVEVLGQGKGKGRVKEEQHGPSRARARLPDPDALPDDFPVELVGHVDRVVAGLREVAEAKGAREVARGRVARLVAGRPRAPWLTELPRFVDYWLYGDGRARSQRDVVQAWQNWIEKRGDLAAVESVVRNGRVRGEPQSSDELVAAARRREEHLERERRERERAGVRS